MITSTNGKAIYLVIADKIIDEILGGKLNPGDRIPSIRDYAAKVEVNHNTVSRAYDYLSDKGLIFNRRGIGYYIADDAVKIGSDIRSRELLGNEIEKIFAQLKLLGVSPDELKEKYKDYLKRL